MRLCEECGEPIPTKRLTINPDTTICVPCLSENDVARYKGIRPPTTEAGQVSGCESDIIRDQSKLKGLKFPTRRVCK